MKNSKFKKILISVATIAGAAMSGLMIWKKWSDNKRKNDADLHKDTYEGAGNPISDEKKTFYEKYLKRAIDIMLSLVGIIVLSPVFVVTAIAIYITDPGPVIFTQKRVGVNKTFFKLYKFRSMKMSTPHDVPTHMLDNPESYITSVGKFIRKTSIDELPQLFNILEGNLSVIGPRPALWNQEDLVKERDKYCANDVMPGLTGWAQINGRDELEIPVKAKLDGEYVDRLRKNVFSGIAMDVKCFFGTITSVLKSDGVVEGGTGELKKNSRYDIEDVDTTIGFGEDVTVDFSQMRKVLITGANSYIGESFEKYAKERYNTNFKIDTIDMIDGSWREQDFSDYDTVFHVAGIAHADVGNVSDEVKDKYYAVNTDLAIETAKKARQDGVKQFVFMSSMIIYGDSAPYGKQKMITAETKPEPANFYGDSKWQADKGVRVLADETFHVLVLRSPMIYGKGSKGNYPTLAKLAKKLPVFPDVNNQRSMLYIENLCEFLCQVMLVGKGGIFFPQNAEYTKTADMVKMISKAAGKKIWVTKLLNPFVWIGSKMPGKIGGLINKAFGNSCYDKKISIYEEMRYQKMGLKESVVRTEGKQMDKTRRKKIAIISIMYFWLPEESGPSRFYYIANTLAKKGYDVEVITGSFEHFDKKQRDKNMLMNSNIPFDITVIDMDGYKKNIDIRRLLSYRKATRKYLEYLNDHKEEYRAVYCSVPPNDLAAAVAKFCHDNKIPFIADIEDLWPEAMEMALSKFPGKSILFYPLKRDAEKIYKYASAAIGTSDEYTSRAYKNNGRTDLLHRTLYVGSDLDVFDKGVQDNIGQIEKNENEFWAIYAGSIGNTYDIENLIKAAECIKQQGNSDIKIKILGQGVLKEELERLAKELKCDNVEFLGYQPYEMMAAYLVKSDVALNMFAKGAPQSIVNKVGDYFSSGKPVINTLESNEFMNMISSYEVGKNVEPGKPEKLAEAIIDYYNDLDKCIREGHNSRKLAESKFDRKTSYQVISEVIETLHE